MVKFHCVKRIHVRHHQLVILLVVVCFYLPSRSSPKFPHPIFLPTRKFGPTISTPEDVLTECRPEYAAFVPRAPPPVADEPAGTPPL